MASVIPVILCGGSGTRLWPLSHSGFPKQFWVLSGDGSSQSLFHLIAIRLESSSKLTCEFLKMYFDTSVESIF
jgi:mannose-1-phosphate guanylyltransferase/mannose-6-phosphate isomerase